MLVDLSHVAADTMRAALDVSTAPVIFSHSSCRALCDHPRDVPDDVLARLAANGGVIQLTFVPEFVSEECRAWRTALTELRKEHGHTTYDWVWPRAPLPGEDAAAVAAETATRTPNPIWEEEYRGWLARNPRPRATIGQVADHVEHARRVAGAENIGLGGDYDGTDALPEGLDDVSGYPRLLAELARRGWSPDDLAALTGGNVLRVLAAAETTAQEFLAPPTPLP
jgi:membrane dipeptidase